MRIRRSTIKAFSPAFHRALIFATHGEGLKPVVLGAVLIAIVVGARVQSQLAFPRAVRLGAPAVRPATGIERGREVYHRYGCAMCHGADGKGGFANPNAETDGKVPGVTYVAEGYTPAELRQRLLDGTPVVGKADPKGPRPPYRMPGWRNQMTDQEVGDLVQYLFSLQPKTTEEKWR